MACYLQVRPEEVQVAPWWWAAYRAQVWMARQVREARWVRVWMARRVREAHRVRGGQWEQWEQVGVAREVARMTSRRANNPWMMLEQASTISKWCTFINKRPRLVRIHVVPGHLLGPLKWNAFLPKCEQPLNDIRKIIWLISRSATYLRKWDTTTC